MLYHIYFLFVDSLNKMYAVIYNQDDISTIFGKWVRAGKIIGSNLSCI